MSRSEDIKRNSNDIWLAGLGAYATISETGQETFNTLVKKGQAFEKENPPKPTTDSRIDELKSKANQTIDRIEKAFDLRVSSALNRIGIIRKSDLEQLTEKVDTLTTILNRVSKDINRK